MVRWVGREGGWEIEREGEGGCNRNAACGVGVCVGWCWECICCFGGWKGRLKKYKQENVLKGNEEIIVKVARVQQKQMYRKVFVINECDARFNTANSHSGINPSIVRNVI